MKTYHGEQPSSNTYGSAPVESENFYVAPDGTVRHKPEPKSQGRIGGIEL